MVDTLHGALVLIGVILLVIGVQFFFSGRKFRDSGIKTQAVVVENVPVRSRDSKGTSIMYAPLMEYEANGKKLTYIPNASSNPPAYSIGENVAIVYSATNDQDVRIVSFWGIYLVSNILLAFGLPMLLLGVGYFLFKWGLL